ncbi:quinone oxidoreductase, putative [Eimeria necatrix]|uniref:Quinone oxidoreductase, putative n=1 Tax=Eimeria necatrix TaxID=51315 RepID=U6N6G5_9EIME|nr:quinone oxidoreductase, putative [Eimeria necatrix]CDJ70285.1 quinone oxidoreductase, putative [Eimeria necatrix]
MDLLQKAGKYPPPPGTTDILGPEAAGIVVSSTLYKEGTPVACLLPGGGYAEYVAADPALCFPIPSNLTIKEARAACIPENWITAYQLLEEVARLSDFKANGGKPSGIKHALVYAAGSGVGVALLQLFRVFIPSVSVIAVAGSNEKLQRVKELGAAVCLNYKELGDSLGDEVLKATGGQGVDIVLDCVGASFVNQTLKSLKTDGTWVLYGCMGGHRANLSFGVLLQQRLRLLSSTLRSRSSLYLSSLVSRFKTEVVPLFQQNKLKVIIDAEFSPEAAEEAHKRMQSNSNFGKVLILMDPQLASLNPKP